MREQLSTPRTAAVLRRICDLVGHTEVAKTSQLPISIVSKHASGQRGVRDNHLHSYMLALGPNARTELISAWLRDVLPEDAYLDIGGHHDISVLREVAHWNPQLSHDQNAMLEWWAQHIALDPDLEDILTKLAKQLGFTKEPTPDQYMR